MGMRRQVMFKAVFKLTGRYMLTDGFDYKVFDNPHNVFKYASVGEAAERKPGYAYTCFFKISEPHVSLFHDMLLSMIRSLQMLWNKGMPTKMYDDVETRLAPELPDVLYVANLGVQQRVSTYDTPDEYITDDN